MHTRRRSGYPKLAPVPSFVFNTAEFQRVLVFLIEKTAFSRKKMLKLSGTMAERLAAAECAMKSKRTMLLAALDSLAVAYVQEKTVGGPMVKHYERKIQELDTRLRMLENPAATIGAILYRSWRLGEDSVTVAAAVGGLKPVHVRQILCRCRKAVAELEAKKKGAAEAAPVVN